VNVQVSAFTGDNGCLMVFAGVDPGCAKPLEDMVMSTSPPVPVLFELTEFPVAHPTTRPTAADLKYETKLVEPRPR
jgi:hypothetical protein